jgi:metal-responsive CopG/Arc/MetJ family transcriptional regulator
MKRRKNEYTTIKLPKILVDRADNYVDEHPEYTSRTDLIRDALRRYFDFH